MDLKQLDSFIHIAELGSFTKAADRLGYSQSTISFQIRQLEESLGVPLFERINHTVSLTEKGTELLEYAHQIRHLAEQMHSCARIHTEMTGHIRIAMAASLSSWLLKDKFEAFHREYPNISLKIIQASTEEMFRLLNQNEVDLVFTLDSHIYHKNYVIVSEEPVHVHFVAAAGHPLVKEKNLSIYRVIKEPLILTEKGMSYRKPLEEHLAKIYLEPEPFLEIGDTALICHLTAQGMGISFLPDYVTLPDMKAGKLAILDVADSPSNLWIQLLYHKSKWITPALQSVIDYLSESLHSMGNLNP